MNTVAKLTQKQIEKLAVEIRTFLLEHDMWVDTQIYFNGKCFDTHDKETGEFYYNDPEHLVVRENEDPRRYFENVAEDHILSMAFEGSVCHMLWYGTNPGIKKKFERIFEKRGIYYEFGDHWNFTCYYIETEQNMGHRKMFSLRRKRTQWQICIGMIMNFHGIIPRQRQSEDGEET